MRLVLAYDGSENARKAVNFAVKVFKAGDEFHLVTVVREAPRSPEQIVIDSESKAEDLLQEIEGELRGFRVVKKILETDFLPALKGEGSPHRFGFTSLI